MECCWPRPPKLLPATHGAELELCTEISPLRVIYVFRPGQRKLRSHDVCGVETGPVRAEMMKLFSNSVVEMSTTTASAISLPQRSDADGRPRLLPEAWPEASLRVRFDVEPCILERRRKTEDQARTATRFLA